MKRLLFVVILLLFIVNNSWGEDAVTVKDTVRAYATAYTHQYNVFANPYGARGVYAFLTTQSGLILYKSETNGQTWDSLQVLHADSTYCADYTWFGDVDSVTIYLVYGEGQNQNDTVFYRRLVIYGDSLNPIVGSEVAVNPSQANQKYPTIVLDDSGYIYVGVHITSGTQNMKITGTTTKYPQNSPTFNSYTNFVNAGTNILCRFRLVTFRNPGGTRAGGIYVTPQGSFMRMDGKNITAYNGSSFTLGGAVVVDTLETSGQEPFFRAIVDDSNFVHLLYRDSLGQYVWWMRASAANTVQSWTAGGGNAAVTWYTSGFTVFYDKGCDSTDLDGDYIWVYTVDDDSTLIKRRFRSPSSGTWSTLTTKITGEANIPDRFNSNPYIGSNKFVEYSHNIIWTIDQAPNAVRGWTSSNGQACIPERITQAPSGTPDRLYTSGFETPDIDLNTGEWKIQTRGAFDTAIKRTGNYSGKVATTALSGGFLAHIGTSTTAADKIAHRVYFRFPNTPSAEHSITYRSSVTNGLGSPKISVRIKTDRTLVMVNEEDNIRLDSLSTVLNTNAWYAIALFVDATTIASASAKFKFWTDPNGIPETSKTVTGIALAAVPISVVVGWSQAVTDTFYYDDIAVNEENGAGNNNTFPDSGRVTRMRPNAGGSDTMWTANGTANNWDCVDDTLANTSADYVSETTVGDTDYYNCQNISEIPDSAKIKIIQVNFVGARGGTNPDYFKLLLRDGNSGAPSDTSGRFQFTTATYVYNRTTGANPQTSKLNSYGKLGNPDSVRIGLDVNNIQIGLIDAQDVTNAPNITMEYMNVEWIGQGAAGGEAKRSRLPEGEIF